MKKEKAAFPRLPHGLLRIVYLARRTMEEIKITDLDENNELVQKMDHLDVEKLSDDEVDASGGILIVRFPGRSYGVQITCPACGSENCASMKYSQRPAPGVDVRTGKFEVSTKEFIKFPVFCRNCKHMFHLSDAKLKKVPWGAPAE